jgi:hypothetical protein
MVRNPLKVVGSTISMMRAIVRLSFGQETDSDLDREVYDLLRFYYLYALEQLDSLPSDRVAIVKYDDMLRDPRAAFDGVYRHFGWEQSPEFAAALTEEAQAMRQHKSSHSYSLSDSCITQEQIRDDLRAVFERYGFDAGPWTSSQHSPAETAALTSS